MNEWMSSSIHPSINEYIVDAYQCDGKFLANKRARTGTNTDELDTSGETNSERLLLQREQGWSQH